MSSLQKRMAASILKVGESKIWLDPTKTKEIAAAITKSDIRKLIMKGHIKVARKKIKFREKIKKGKKGRGSRKGRKHAIVTAKRKWISTVRPLRRMLKELRDSSQIDNQTYRKLYMLVKGGTFRSRSHMRIYLEQHGLVKKK